MLTFVKNVAGEKRQLIKMVVFNSMTGLGRSVPFLQHSYRIHSDTTFNAKTAIIFVINIPHLGS
jgi:hypothetical protein